MLAEESGGAAAATTPNFDLPEEVLQWLPSDPFEQLDVARKITSIALSTRVSLLESELSVLQSSLTERDTIITDLQSQLESLDSSLSDANDKLSRAEEEKESLLKENASLASTVRRLQRDVAKLESFRKTLMRSLQDEEETPGGGPKALPPRAPSQTGDDSTLATSRTSSIISQLSDSGNTNTEDSESEATRPRVLSGLLLASQTSTPRLTPPGSPPSLSTSVSPSRSPRIPSPRRHSISFSTTRGMFDDRSSAFSMPPSQYSSMPGYDKGSQAGRTRVDGKEFFRQVRSRLSYEQFGAFLANVKDLNSHKQTREETLRKAEEIFGEDNKDLYAIFEGLITRNVQ